MHLKVARDWARLSVEPEPLARVLVIDIDREAREVLEEQLRRAGHAVTSAATAEEGLRMARERRPDVVLLDGGAADRGPSAFCQELHADMATRGVPVVAMLAADQSHARAVSVSGVAEAIGKPFTVRELLARVESALRGARPEVDRNRPIEFGVLRVERDQQRVWVAGHEVSLTPLEFRLLVTLHDRRDQVQSRDTLLTDVWGISPDVTTRTVDTHVKRLRNKLGEAADYVQTVRGIGYRFAASPDERATED
jgi:two-component system phosphate regulon response regulator PhoB